jgi:hypothetical protein
MLKKITLTALFVIASAVGVASALQAKSAPKAAASSVVTPSAPQPKGFCWPPGGPC